MKKARKLKELKSKLKDYNKTLEAYEKRKYHEDGKLNFEILVEMQKVQTDICQIEKQINFVNQGKHHLGDEIGTRSINEYL